MYGEVGTETPLGPALWSMGGHRARAKPLGSHRPSIYQKGRVVITQQYRVQCACGGGSCVDPDCVVVHGSCNG